MALDTTKTAHEIINSGRSTGQTVIDKDGNLKWALHNRVQTDLDNAAEWTLINLSSSVEAGVNANGKKRYLLTEDTSAGVSHRLNDLLSVVSGETYTIAAIAEANGRYAAFSVGAAFGTERWVFDLDTLAVVRQAGTSTTSTATATTLTGGEVLIEFTATSEITGNVYLDISLWDGGAGDTAYDGDGTSGLYVSEVKVYQSTIGPRELIKNGRDLTNTDNWTAVSDATLSAVAGQLSVQVTTPDDLASAVQAFPTVVGRTYYYTVEKVSQTGNSFWGFSTTSGGGRFVNFPTDEVGVKSGSFVASTETTYVQLWAGNSGADGTTIYDNISVLDTPDAMQRDKFGSNFLENETGAALYGLGIDYSTGRGGLQVYEGRTNLVPYFEVTDANWNPDGAGVLTDQSLNVLGVFNGCLVESGGAVSNGAINTGAFSITSGTDYAVSFVWSDSDSSSIGIRLFEAAVGISQANVTTAGVFTQDSSAKGTIVLGSHVEILPGLYRTTVIWTPNFTGNGLISAGPYSATIGDSIILYCGSIEEGSSASPLIPTYGSTVTRGKDDLSTLVSSFGYNVNAGTIVADFVTPGTDGADFPRVWQLATSVDNTTRVALTAITNYVASYVEDGVQQTATVMGAVVPNAQVKIAAAFATDDFAASQDGGAVVATTSGNLPTTFTQLLYGKAFIADHLNGLIYSLVYYPFRAPNEQLVEASS